MFNNTVKDSSIWFDPTMSRGSRGKDPFLRLGIVKTAISDVEQQDIRYLVEINDRNDKINVNCRMMRRFGGVYNYEDVVYRGYTTNNIPDPIQNWNAKAGDIVIVAFFNGEGREGVILGGVTHAARDISLDPALGPQYQSEFNGMLTNINKDGEWTLTFRGQPTNLAALNNVPSTQIAAPTYNTTIGSTFMKFDKTGGWIISDNATSNTQYFHIDKAGGTITTMAGTVSLKLDKNTNLATLSASKIFLSNGKATPTEPFVLGNKTVKWLNDLIDAIEAINYLGNLGAPVLGTLNQAAFESLRSRINNAELLSSFIMGEK